jgi:perosamine synthetase
VASNSGRQDLKAPLFHSRPQLGNEEMRACERVVRSGYLASGPETKCFETELQARFKRKHAIVVSSGQAALHLSLLAMGVKASSRVVMPSYVCTALLNAVGLIGAQVKLWDIEKKGVHMDAQHLGMDKEESRGVGENSQDFYIAPQMFGLCKTWHCPPERFVEDAAMALGPKAMAQGRLSITSFYATKMMTTAQGGAIFTDDDNCAAEIRDLMAYDNREDYRQRYNVAPTDLGSALGRAQLSQLDDFLEARHNLALAYDAQILKHCPQLLAIPQGLSTHGPGLFRYWVCVGNLQTCIQHLHQAGIEAKSPVYKPLHRYLKLRDEDFPETSWAQASILSLPFYPALDVRQVERVVCSLAEVALPALHRLDCSENSS